MTTPTFGALAASPQQPGPNYYITNAEFLASPTSVNVTDLVSGGTLTAESQALSDMIRRASSMIDQQILNQPVQATLNVQRGRYRVSSTGSVRVPLRFKPVLEVRSLLAAGQPVLDLSGVIVGDTGVVEIPLSNYCPGDIAYLDITYVAGYPNCRLISPLVAPGGIILSVDNPTGIYPGTQLTIYDGANTETAIVSSRYTYVSQSVPLASPLLNPHGTGVSVGNMPDIVKEACILVTCALIQARGDDAIILEAMEEPSRSSDAAGDMNTNITMARNMLLNLDRVW